MAKRYRIDLIINAQQADQTAARSAAAQKKVADASLETAKSVEASAERQAKAAERAAQAQMKAYRDAHEATRKDAERAAAAAEKAAEKQARDAERAAAAQERAQQRVHDNISRNNRRIEAELNRQAAQEIRDTERKMVSLDSLRMKAIEYKDAQIAAGKAASEAFNTGAAQAMTVAAGALVRQFQAVRETAYEAQKMVKDYLEALAELAALKGQTGKSSQTLAEDIKFRAATLQKRDESIAFQRGVRDVAEAFTDTDKQKKLISPQELEKASRIGGAISVIKKIAPEAAGTMTGIIPMVFNRRMTGEEVAQEQVRMLNMFQKGNASLTSLTNQFTKSSKLMTSGFYDPTEAAMLLSAFSLSSKDEAGETLQQFTRATVGGMGRMRGAKMEGYDTEKTGRYLGRLGAKPGMKATEIGDLIVADMERQEVLAKKAGRRPDPYFYLKQHGFGNQEDVEALLQYKGIKQGKAIEQTFGPIAAQLPSFQSIQAEISAAQLTEPHLMQRKADLAGEAANIKIGAGPEGYYYALQKIAFEKLKADKTLGVTGEYEQFGTLGGLATNPAQAYGLARVRSEMRRMVDEQRKQAGLKPIQQAYGHMMGQGLFATGISEPEAYFKSAIELGGKGQDVLTPVLTKLADIADKQLKEQEKLRIAVENAQKQGAGPVNNWMRAPGAAN
jgi:hypothetical protein